MNITKSKLIIGGVVLAAAVAAATAGTLAFFTSTQTSGGNTFSTGTIQLNGGSTTIMTYAGNSMMPSDGAQGSVTVTNGAGVNAANQLRYAIGVSVSGSGDPGLTNALVLTVRLGDGTAADAAASGGTCSTYNGFVLYQGDLDGDTSHRIIGDAAVGQNSNINGTATNHDRVLNSTESDVLCFSISLPYTVTDSALMGKSVTAVFTFTAEQTKNT